MILALIQHRTGRDRTGAVLRLGARTVRTNGWRNVLIAGMIAVAVGIAVLTAITTRSTRVPEDAYLQQIFGTADVVVDEYRNQIPLDALTPEQREVARLAEVPADQAALPPVPEVVVEVLGTDTPVTGYVRAYLRELTITDLDPRDPLAEGMYVVDGPTPGPGQALLSPTLLADLDASVGQDVSLPGIGQVEVVGTVSDPYYRQSLALVEPGSLGQPRTWLIDADDPGDQERLSDAFLGPENNGTAAISRGVSTRAGATGAGPVRGLDAVVASPSFAGTAVGVLMLIMVGFVAAAAFATGLRRRLRTFGLIAAQGASPGQIRSVMLAEALTLGLIGAAVGVALGVLAAVLGQPLMELATGRTVDGIDIAVTDLVAPAIVGIIAAVGAAIWPARTLARTPVSTALGGRIPAGSVPRWLPGVAVVVSVVGLSLLVAVAGGDRQGIGGDALLTLGIGLTVAGATSIGVPLIALAARWSTRAGLLIRVALRDAARQRTRSGATVAALVVVMMIPAVGLTGISTERSGFDPRPRLSGPPVVEVLGPDYSTLTLPVDDRLVDDVIAALPNPPQRIVNVERLVTDTPGVGPQVGGSFGVLLDDVPGASRYLPGAGGRALDTPELRDAAGLDAAARAILDDGRPVELVHPDLPTDAQLEAETRTFRLEPAGPGGRAVETELARFLTDSSPVGQVVLVPGALADTIGVSATSRSVALVLDRVLTGREADALPPAFYELDPILFQPGQAGFYVFHNVFPDPALDQRLPVGLIALGLAVIAALMVVGLTTALAATESDHDLAIMGSVGADPRLRPRFHGILATFHAGLAAAIGVPTGLLMFLAVSSGDGAQPASVPWVDLAILAIGVPLAVGLVMRIVMRPLGSPTRRRLS